MNDSVYICIIVNHLYPRILKHRIYIRICRCLMSILTYDNSAVIFYFY